ncbi:50S ribosomal protein L21e [Candidatus Woesearchaeota archaeon]|nr:50S ribosomal protein L21e [Candidatus Woesearchaeota archaeon]
MVQRVGGFRRKTRYKLSKGLRQRGKLSLTRYLQVFQEGDAVILKAEPSIQRGMYFPRYHGLAGIVEGKTGHCYHVVINDQGKKKTLIVHPVHLQKAQTPKV